MSPVLLAVLIVGGVALAAGVLLAVASVLLAVPVNEKAEKIRAALPGANCGGCGFSGCDAYAAAIAEGKAAPTLCAPGGEEAAKAIAAVVGGEVTVEKKIAVIRCGGCEERAVQQAGYANVSTCAEAARLFGGGKGCLYGCLGLGDCAVACPFHAVTVENGIARVDPAVCRGCGACVAACPKKLPALIPATEQAVVMCRNTDKGAAVRKVCTVGCIGCGKCVKTCPSEAIRLNGALAEVDPAACVGCGACVAECPVKCLTLA